MGRWSTGSVLISSLLLGVLVAPAFVSPNPYLLDRTQGVSVMLGSDFTITMNCSEYLADGGRGDNSTLIVRSDGSAEFSYNSYFRSPHEQTYHTNLSISVVDNAFDALVGEHVFALCERYVDHNYVESAVIRTTTLVVSGSDVAYVAFEGNAMIGIMPHSYAILQNLASATMRGAADPLDVTFNITITKPDPASDMLKVSANFTNNEDTTIYVISWPPWWYASAVKDSGCTVLGSPWWNKTFEYVVEGYAVKPNSTLVIEEGSRTFWWNTSSLGNGTYSLLSWTSIHDSEDTNVTWDFYECTLVNLTDGNDYVDGAPQASFALSTSSGETGFDFVFDPWYSSDAEDLPSELRVRWDFEGDGDWDSNWSVLGIAHHAYSEPGNYTAKLQIRDSSGQVDETSTWVLVEPEDKEQDSLVFLGALLLGTTIVLVVAILASRRMAETNK